MDQKIQSLYNILAAGTMKPVTIKDLTKLCQGKFVINQDTIILF